MKMSKIKDLEERVEVLNYFFRDYIERNQILQYNLEKLLRIVNSIKTQPNNMAI